MGEFAMSAESTPLEPLEGVSGFPGGTSVAAAAALPAEPLVDHGTGERRRADSTFRQACIIVGRRRRARAGTS